MKTFDNQLSFMANCVKCKKEWYCTNSLEIPNRIKSINEHLKNYPNHGVKVLQLETWKIKS